VKEAHPGILSENGCPDECGCLSQGKDHGHQCASGSPCKQGNAPKIDQEFLEDYLDDEAPDIVRPRKLKSKGYMDDYINPPEFLDERKRMMWERLKEKKKFPEHPQKDILLFLLGNAPLNSWQRDILSLIREEAYYFAPQGQTKIMNEGWATYWHSTIMTQKALKASELIDYADHHSGTLAGSGVRLNPYKIGVELFRDIEDRWNKGQFGKEYEECEDLEKKKSWDLQLGLGRQKIFEVRKIHNDITFLDTFLTEEFCTRHNLFRHRYDPNTRRYVIDSRGFREIKEAVLATLTNFGKPFIFVEDGNHNNRGELLLIHRHGERELDPVYAKDTLVNIQYLWKRPVHLQTVIDEKKTLFSFDGERHENKEL
jgi:stage V sporulation protein R